MIITLVGPHGAGKTTLGRALAAELRLPFHEELGRQLAEDPVWRSDGQTAASAQRAFDRELFCRERVRDLESEGSRIVETWHPGNLAYAVRRSPEVAAAWWSGLQPVVRGSFVLPVMASRGTLASRQSEPGDLDFFLEVGHASLCWAVELGAIPLPPLLTDDVCAAVLARKVATFIRRMRVDQPTLPRETPCA